MDMGCTGTVGFLYGKEVIMQQVFSQIKRFEGMTFEEGKPFTIFLPKVELKKPELHTAPATVQADMKVGGNYTISVKKYMTEKGTPSFDFMTKWNNDVPMPLVTMQGTVIKMTRGMVYMKLQGKATNTSMCICCGRLLTNPVSRLYGIGPECGKHFYINPFDTEEELKAHLAEIEDAVSRITWEGWVIKSAIKEYTEV